MWQYSPSVVLSGLQFQHPEAFAVGRQSERSFKGENSDIYCDQPQEQGEREELWVKHEKNFMYEMIS